MHLSDRDRSFILKQLATAPDSVLADAMLEYNLIRDKIVAVRKLAGGEPPADAPVYNPTADVPIPAPDIKIVNGDARPNVDPGKSTITRIGSSTKDSLVGLLRAGKQPDAKWSEHLKLLWQRDEVFFDGKEFYL